MSLDQDNLIRRRLEVTGRVQGVGFRPFVYRLATDLGLTGSVSNDPSGVIIEVEGRRDQVEKLVLRLQKEVPPLAKIESVGAHDITHIGDCEFHIKPSVQTGQQDAEFTPDIATCDDCLHELFDRNDRRYRYPFINCTNCGPRYSIIRSVPYDRCRTTMSVFEMCPACQAEYDDPANRRFHAQPNACPVCGPKVWLTDREGRGMDGNAIDVCAQQIRDGQTAAIKGLGGFHLACRADDEHAVRRLRDRKERETKPFALMVPSLEAARLIADIDEAAAHTLTSPARPIVLARKLASTSISTEVAPETDCFGLMLPYTPLHHLLLADINEPIVMTSGNPSEEPLCCDNDEAEERLASIADVFLFHDRDIERRVDDSVVLAVDRPARTVLPIRRARGYAPAPIHLDAEAPEPILAVGGELKSAICIYASRSAVLSEHLGELSNPAAYRHFVRTIERFGQLLHIEPRLVACDLHPDYAATRWAHNLALPNIDVQHHHAHAVGCMADNRITGKVVAISCDGTGYGTDGAIWGCEVFVCSEAEFERSAHLRYYPLLGGDAAAKQTWRPAAGLLHDAFGSSWREQAEPLLQRVPEDTLVMADKRLAHTGRPAKTSSLGRLCDAVAFLLGCCDYNHHEAQAAMALEALADSYAGTPAPLPQTVTEEEDILVLDARPLIAAIVSAMTSGGDLAALARGFHDSVAGMLASAAIHTARRKQLDRVVLSGGCFVNRLLLDGTATALTQAGLQVFTHQQTPPGDGGLALGQAVVAAARIRRSDHVSGRTRQDCHRPGR
jgi:hydrogenase maturation protein HypF